MQESKSKSGRGGLFWTSMGLLAGLVAWKLAGPALTFACRPHPAISGTLVTPKAASGLPYDELPGIDLSGLTRRQRFLVLHRAASQRCDCGCKETLAECRHSDPTCKKGLKLATQLRDEVARTSGLDLEPGH